MKWSIGIGRMFGIRIELHVTFLLFLGWIGLQGFLAGDMTRAVSTVTLVLLIFSCILLHELGHALTARRYGVRTRDIVLLPIGGVARLERMPEKPWQEVMVAIAGPAVNVAIAIVLGALMLGLNISMDQVAFTGGLIESLMFVNLLIVGFNMIPAFPMDGGRVLRALLAMRLPYVRATRIASFVGQGVAVLFGITGLMSSNFMLVFIAMFVFLAASEERAVVQTRASVSSLPVSAAMLREFRVLHINEHLQTVVAHLMGGAQQDFPVLDDGRPVGLVSHREVLQGVRELGPEATVRDVLDDRQSFAEPTESLEDVIQRLRDLGRTAFPVVHQGRLVGMVTLEQVSELLMVQDAMRRHQGAG